ncbi:Acetyltransferase (GNAT) domain-containing protein [Aquiflexum balticum DSM 16537]|uniref:Acetyltransferase (GNAT) domain-containing protein n=1 Tax=Aquiflexum balticum DSM 16537 TaxID=758820 RepID=A0A1W2HBN2_9BACT|nr:GNAT family N-acetyltransferase [Aquiflexum balticum]SMD46290.1 Acetyltransferase (GNAT) domain-containing protein [Aquiflexum balticum DSM 16537]
MNSRDRKRETVIKIFHGEEAIRLLHEESLQRKWSSLVQQFENSSIFQSPDFVLPWYLEHQNEFSPLLILAFSSDQLVGILTLARKLDHTLGKPCKMLFGAGNNYALYQTWLVLPDFREAFWELGIKQIFKKFPGCSINLKSLPNLDDYVFLSQHKDFKSMTALEKSHNPVLDFEEENFKRIIGKRHFRSKFNRLNRAGEVQFKKLESPDELSSAFGDIFLFYNLRHGAAFNKIPFPNGNIDKQLFLEWFKKGVLHASILYLDGDLIGSVIMLDDFGKTAHLAGLITYSPSHAKFSPGLVHLYLLAQMLKEESFQNLKLSPGYDVYKERFSNTHEEIYELLISASLYQIWRRKLRGNWRRFLLKKGIRPMEIGVQISKKSATLKNKWFNLKNHLFTRKLSQTQIFEKLNQFEEKDFFESKIQYHFNELSTLLMVDDFTFELSRWEFLEDSLKRLEAGYHFVTLVKGNNLLACIWTEKNFKNNSVLKDILKGKEVLTGFFSKNLLIAIKK